MFYKKNFFIFSIIFNYINAYNLCVVGGSSGLGRELIYQSLKKNNKILTLTNNPENIKIPYRGGGLENKNSNLLLRSPNLKICNYDDFINYNFSNIVFTTGSKPFSKDYSDIITKKILECNSLNLKNIVLISAYGVGDSLNNANTGIKIMNNLYLQDVYRAKNAQEELLNNYKKNNPTTNINILRPKALSYGVNLYSAKSRETFANEILDFFINT